MPVDLGQYQDAREYFLKRAQGMTRGGGQPTQPSGTVPLPTGTQPPPMPPPTPAPTPSRPPLMNPQMPRTDIQQLGQSMPDEAMVIVKALINRLKSLGGEGKPQYV